MTQGTCRLCGNAGNGESFIEWVKPTFTDWDKLKPGEIVCSDCLFYLDEKSAVLTERMKKDKPQRMRNYSHFVLNGVWTPLSKGDKAQMTTLLTGEQFPELAAIAVSGQRHIVFRARRNPAGAKSGWVQFEDHAVWVNPSELRDVIATVEALYTTFSKSEIESGDYMSYRIMAFGLQAWDALEQRLSPLRGGHVFALALFLAQRTEEANDADTSDDDDEGTSRDAAGGAVARRAQRLQEQVPPHDMGAIRKPRKERGVHEQPAEIYQPVLF